MKAMSSGRRSNGYSPVEWDLLRRLSASLIGSEDVNELIARFGFSSEEELCRELRCKDLLSLFLEGNLFANMSRLRHLLRPPYWIQRSSDSG